jgi:hypothetical protein
VICRARGTSRHSTVGFVAGGVGLGAAIVLFVTSSHEREPGASASPVPRIVPFADARGGGLGLSGRF